MKYVLWLICAAAGVAGLSSFFWKTGPERTVPPVALSEEAVALTVGRLAAGVPSFPGFRPKDDSFPGKDGSGTLSPSSAGPLAYWFSRRAAEAYREGRLFPKKEKGPAVFARPLARTAGRGKYLRLTLPDSAFVRYVMVEEETGASLSRVTRYRVECYDGKSRWHPVCGGRAVGRRRLHEVEAPRRTRYVRLCILEADSIPVIRHFAVYP